MVPGVGSFFLGVFFSLWDWLFYKLIVICRILFILANLCKVALLLTFLT